MVQRIRQRPRLLHLPRPPRRCLGSEDTTGFRTAEPGRWERGLPETHPRRDQVGSRTRSRKCQTSNHCQGLKAGDMDENENDPLGLNRRDFLRGGSFATLMTMLGGVPLLAPAE